MDMIKVENVSKEYRLGAIGGGTLQRDLQSWWARKRGKEDPNAEIGAKVYGKNEKFLALDDVSFTVQKGERVGIIGKNGAGKSTLLKLFSRVTAPTGGTIYLNGRVASMLEVGTGFHGELTGRENIYMNGAILGMTRKEIDERMEEIIEFSECRKFIDTPVKRYSSGMYVKLAFAVAAHLNSEIMIMDEVLAVGDMAFQKKCLDKMNDVSREQGRTILYVSHNMNTIRQLCQRVIVLEEGKVIFDGETEEGIQVYLGGSGVSEGRVDFTGQKRITGIEGDGEIVAMEILGRRKWAIEAGENVRFTVTVKAHVPLHKASFRVRIITGEGIPVSMLLAPEILSCEAGETVTVTLEAETSMLAHGSYRLTPALYGVDEFENYRFYDYLEQGISLRVDAGENQEYDWNRTAWGGVRLPEMRLIDN